LCGSRIYHQDDAATTAEAANEAKRRMDRWIDCNSGLRTASGYRVGPAIAVMEHVEGRTVFNLRFEI
jgi:hypothetical protein